MMSADGNVGKELETSTNNAVNGVGEDDEDDVPMLSSHTLEALKEFLAEQNQAAESEDAEEVSLVTEDWRLSQFWYDRQTAEAIVAEVSTLCETLSSPRVSCIACPTLYAYLKKIAPELPAQLLEYDKRFEQYGTEFTFYDYSHPEDLPLSLKHSFPIVVADPPYLSKECLEKVAETVRFLSKPGESFVLLLTGEVQTVWAAELLGLRPCGFRPQHSSKLGNEFRLFTSYDPRARLGGWEN
ncbi:nucleic acid binding / methyltransferase [Perilla frutescens var. hirtella]|uniref:Protein-lysine N-methyltransferase C2S53_001096 n=1 Tax=Perilla frutescens var. hirtella TaxID=608512 RepID=A0AAD4IPI8_PERFH|nr:nucleic acid binding / methyltransferase [Perilla frutescens var. hirtella]